MSVLTDNNISIKYYKISKNNVVEKDTEKMWHLKNTQ